MFRCGIRLAALACAAVLCLAQGDPAAAAPSCLAAKFKAIGLKEAAVLKCRSKVVTSGDDEKLAACVAKADQKFLDALAKAEAGGACGGSASTCDCLIDDCTAAVLASLPDAGPNGCEGSRLKAAGNLAKDLMLCNTKAASSGAAVDGECITGKIEKFEKAFAKTTGCTGNAEDVVATVRSVCIRALDADDSGGSVPTAACTAVCPAPSTTSTMTSTTMSAPSTTTLPTSTTILTPSTTTLPTSTTISDPPTTTFQTSTTVLPTTTTTTSVCGDGETTGSEECDDADDDDRDGCMVSCRRGAVCPSGPGVYFEPASGHCYVPVLTEASYADSRDACVLLGGHLATLTSPDEAIAVWAHADGVDTRNYWIGLDDLTTEGAFDWVTDEPFDYGNWHSGEPDNAGGREDCVTMNRWRDATWTDERCTL
ncbi:MAG TPA: C-type lectin domain-containing protein, partial [Candidatus Binatia bacterium]|nr:C-type lectin domain-containing protein [Candidatus Binatia bacterium]